MRVFLLTALALSLAGSEVRGLQSPAQGAPVEGQAQTSVGDVITPRIIKRVQPNFPEDLGEQVGGDVVMDVTIAADGTVKNIKVTHGLPHLTPFAVHAVSQWQYEPARVNGVAVPYKTTIVVHFKQVSDTATAPAMNAAEMTAPRIVPRAGVMGVKPALPPPPDGVLRIAAKVMEGMLEVRVEPAYPADAVALDARGVVMLLATVTKSGDVADVQVLSGPERFRDAAMVAVKQWKYKAYEVDGEARMVQTAVTLNFAPPK